MVEEERENDYCTRNLHGLRWDDGITDYWSLGIILKSKCKNSKIILTKGREKKDFWNNF